MLNSIRSSVNSTLTRVILFIAAIAFAFSGAGMLGSGKGNYDIVTFYKLPNIKLNEFYKEKNTIIKQLTLQGQQINPEILEQMDINRQIISNMLRDRYVAKWLSDTEIEIGDKSIKKIVRANPAYLNPNGEFDKEKYKAHMDFLERQSVSTEEMYKKMKFSYAQNMLQYSVTNSVAMPKLLSSIISDYFAETKSLNLIKINLSDQGKLPKQKISDEEAKEYFEKNSEDFKIPEVRSINYIIIDHPKINPEKDVSEELSLKYFDDNISDFEGSSYEKEKASIKKILANDILHKKIEEEVKNLEDMVASSEGLAEIAKKYSVKIQNFKGDKIAFDNNALFNDGESQVFSMQEQDISYPVSVDKNFVLFEVDKITSEQIPDFDKIKNIIRSEILKRKYTELNLENLALIEKELDSSKFMDMAKKYAYKVQKLEISRDKESSEIPYDLYTSVLETKKGDVSKIVIDDNFAYIASVYDSKIPASNSNKKEINNIAANKFSEGYIMEIIKYYEGKFPFTEKLDVVFRQND
jgi:peptidyl-prolyl cis-trans isomerase D